MYDPAHNSSERAVQRSARQASMTYIDARGGGPAFSLRDTLQIVWRRLWVILLVALIFVGTAVGFSLWQTPVYQASVKIFLNQKPQDGQQFNLSGSVQGLEQLAQTMVEAINSRSVAEEAIQRLGLEMTPGQLLSNLTVEQIGGTQFIRLSYSDVDPERAKKVVNTVANVASERISQTSASASIITATVWDYAITPSTPVSPDPVRNGLLGLGLGLMLGIALAFLLEYLDDSWRSPEEVEQVSGVPTFGVIPKFETVNRKGKKG
jgi:capsular polysaccharide biosynthesis protein